MLAELPRAGQLTLVQPVDHMFIRRREGGGIKLLHVRYGRHGPTRPLTAAHASNPDPDPEPPDSIRSGRGAPAPPLAGMALAMSFAGVGPK
jgi:hypothetical protein